jgi:DNA primase
MNDFSRSDLDDLKASVDLAHVIRSTGLELRQVGQGLFCRCPFHDDDQASLSVTPVEGLWNCFGCEAGGDALSFLQKREGLSFPAAVARLRELAGKLPAPKPNGKAKPAVQPGQHAPLLARVAEIYARALLLSKEAQDYLERRCLGSKDMWKAFGLGYADGTLLETVPGEGEIVDALKATGLLTTEGKEFFRGCVVVPLTHPDFGVMGFYGRRLSDKAKVKHLFLPGQRRGALNWQCLRQTSELVVTESVFDALSLWVAGVRDVSCLFGVSSVPIDLAELLVRHRVATVTFCLDGDRAGREAASARAAELLSVGIASNMVLLPEGQDPNEILTSSGPEALKAQLEKPVPLMAPEEPSFAVSELEDGFEMRFGEISYRVVFKSPGTGSLRASVKAAKDGITFLNALDLGSHRGRTSTANQVSRRFRLPKADVEAHFMRLVEEAETRAVGGGKEEFGQTMSDLVKEAPDLSDDERRQAVEFLSRPDLVETILEDMEQLGYVGEEKGKLLAYLVGLSRKLDKPLAAYVNSQSSAGKSGMTEAVEALTAPEDVVNFARLSTHALSYMPPTFLKHKLVILEERVGGEAADYSIRVLQSKQKLSQAVVVKDPATGVMQTRYFEVEGPIAYLETTTSGRINYENATRCFEIGLDESEAQTERIHQRQRDSRTLERFRSQAYLDLIKKRHYDSQRVLEPVKVVIPYVHLLRFPSRWLRTRRDHERFLCLIDVAAFLHQYQRKRGVTVDTIGEEIAYVEASFEDYVLAYELAQEVLKASFHELSRSARDLWDVIATATAKGGAIDATSFTRRQLRAITGWPDRRLREALHELSDMEYLASEAGSQGRAYHYSVLADPNEAQSPSIHMLTTPQELKEQLALC